MSKTYDEWLKYYEGCNKTQVIFDIMLDGQEIERLNNIINEFDRYIDEIINERIEKIEGTRFLKGGFTIEQNYLRRRLHERLQELKHKKIYGSVDSEIVYFDELGSDK